MYAALHTAFTKENTQKSVYVDKKRQIIVRKDSHLWHVQRSCEYGQLSRDVDAAATVEHRPFFFDFSMRTNYNSTPTVRYPEVLEVEVPRDDVLSFLIFCFFFAK